VLSSTAADRLRPVLDDFLAGYDRRARIPYDPIEFPLSYRDPDDIEVAAVFSACLAYGRVDLFKPKLKTLFNAMGKHPGRFIRDMKLPRDLFPFRDLTYRFNVGADLATLAVFLSRLMNTYGSVGAAVGHHFKRSQDLRAALSALARELLALNRKPVERSLGPVRGLTHLFPDPGRGGACKRQMLLLRWMVRGPDGLDLGIWRDVPPSALTIPLDTHIARVSRRIGLTDRRTLGWRTANEITDSLKQLDREDPIKYDFALCHLGMSGACPPRLTVGHCRRCPLSRGCRTGAARIKRVTR
jgi:uncharacterized protein (TIGR02757 family)